MGADGGGDEQEHADQQLARVEAVADHGVIEDRDDQHAAHAHRGGLGRAVQATEEFGQFHQPQRSDSAHRLRSKSGL